jgi:hypothetical protein
MVDTLLLLLYLIALIAMVRMQASIDDNVNELQKYIDILCDKIDTLGTEVDKFNAHISRVEDEFDQLKAFQDQKEP